MIARAQTEPPELILMLHREEWEHEFEAMPSEERDAAFRASLEAARNERKREVKVWDKKEKRYMGILEHHVETASWRANWDKTHAAKRSRVEKAPNAEERLAELLATKEWRGSEIDRRSFYFSPAKASIPGIKLRHPSGAQCILWVDA